MSSWKFYGDWQTLKVEAEKIKHREVERIMTKPASRRYAALVTDGVIRTAFRVIGGSRFESCRKCREKIYPEYELPSAWGMNNQ